MTDCPSTLERVLLRNLVPFWYPQAMDEDAGGYRLNHDARGRWRGPAPKYALTQARVLWFFARLGASRYGAPEHVEAARHGFAFLRDRLWDDRYGGVYWSLEADGRTPRATTKHLYAQAFALFALARFVLATGDDDARDLAERLFALLERRAHDARYGGYRQVVARDWDEDGAIDVHDLGDGPGVKTTNVHLHLLEAVAEYVRATHDPRGRERLLELIRIQSSAVVRRDVAACSERFAADWTPLGDDPVSFGHDLEAVSVLIDACAAAQVSDAPLQRLFSALFANALRFGYDARRGGFFESAPAGRPADRRDKVGWVQAEALLASLHLALRTGDAAAERAFRGTLDAIVRRQCDWRHGEWHERVGRFRVRPGPKAGPWKGPYHAGRALLTALELLDATDEAAVLAKSGG